MNTDSPSLISFLRRKVLRRPTVAEKFSAETNGLVSWMREADVKIGYFDLDCDGEPVVVLIGRGHRADDLTAAYEALNVDVVFAESFDPPLSLKDMG
jgi:hypothetical protein